jgi:hypothetical protein
MTDCIMTVGTFLQIMLGTFAVSIGFAAAAAAVAGVIWFFESR